MQHFPNGKSGWQVESIIGKVQQNLKPYDSFIQSITLSMFTCYFLSKVFKKKVLVTFPGSLKQQEMWGDPYLDILVLKIVLPPSFVKQTLGKFHTFLIPLTCLHCTNCLIGYSKTQSQYRTNYFRKGAQETQGLFFS